jgi:hypothetical protein
MNHDGLFIVAPDARSSEKQTVTNADLKDLMIVFRTSSLTAGLALNYISNKRSAAHKITTNLGRLTDELSPDSKIRLAKVAVRSEVQGLRRAAQVDPQMHRPVAQPDGARFRMRLRGASVG